MSLSTHHPDAPPVRVTEADYERLAGLAEALHSEGGRLLRHELDRARLVVDPAREAQPFVRLGSRIDYLDLNSGRSRRVVLTLPQDADIDAGRLSVATPVGAALIGLAAGDTFAWTGADGRPHVILVETVGPAPAAAGVQPLVA
jgi:regulator of nucleoside diphosphate kinase